MERKPQNLSNHAKFDEVFHFFLAPVSLLAAVMCIIRFVRSPSFDTGWVGLAAIAFLLAVFKMRLYSLKVQDRVIRLEERMRLKELLPDNLQSRIPELTERQLIGLRFASDGELAGLVRKTLDNGWNTKQIKEAIQTWRPDYWRV